MILDAPPLQWSPKIVGERLVEALRWARYAGGPVGPSGIRSGMPAFFLTPEERLEEGWDMVTKAEEDAAEAARRLRIAATPAQISAHEAALQWPAVYLVARHPESARVLGLWACCKVYKRPFDKALERRGVMSRAMAYRFRDRGLSIISVGLDRDGVPL